MRWPGSAEAKPGPSTPLMALLFWSLMVGTAWGLVEKRQGQCHWEAIGLWVNRHSASMVSRTGLCHSE